MLVVAIALVVAMPGVSAAQAETETIHLATVDTVALIEPCHQQSGLMTIVQQGVIHVTQLPSGAVHLAATFVGDFSFTPDDPAGITYECRAAVPLTENTNSKTFVSTRLFNTVLHGSDGTMFKTNDIAHVTIDAQGNVRVDFHTDRPVCRK